eukprot:CAMPEP_0118977726 /NCGR_PEP_ID=MMETSP1173-20130426/22134_1 /TAXON_ID=1034831 /ORGANISM="Rhizochromulina marina cf, Strain CCMP1243" /LENGTH=46 /DNA_ID= /DNA_START= /DNA_END= /DNA_ORIENTATION=
MQRKIPQRGNPPPLEVKGDVMPRLWAPPHPNTALPSHEPQPEPEPA